MLAVLRLHQSLVEEGRAVLADGDVAAGQRLVLGVEADEGGELLLDLVQPVVDRLLLVEQGVRLGVLKGLLDVLQLGVELRLEIEQLGRRTDQPRLNPAAAVDGRPSPAPG